MLSLSAVGKEVPRFGTKKNLVKTSSDLYVSCTNMKTTLFKV